MDNDREKSPAEKRLTSDLTLIITQCSTCINDIFIEGKPRCLEYGKHPDEYLLNKKDCPSRIERD